MKKFYVILAAIAAFTLGTNAQELKSGQLEVGDFEGSTELVEGSYFDVAPTSFYIAHTGSQMIYTADDLADLVGDPAKTDVKITKLTYRFYNEGAWDDITRNVKIFIQPLEENEFAVIDGIKQFFLFDTSAPVLEYEYSVSLIDVYDDDGLLEIDLSNAPFEVTPGKGMLVTAVFDAQDDDNCTAGTYVSFYSTGLRGRAMTYTDNWDSFMEYTETDDFPDATAFLGCGTNIDLPVTLIDYTYQEEDNSGINELYMVGTFNDWNQNEDGGRIAFDFADDEFIANVDLEDGAEFKLIAPAADGGWQWFGGRDDNQVGYFLINDDLLGVAITLMDGANFKIENGGNYTISVCEGLRGLNEPLVMTVTESLPTAITDINSSGTDNTWYNIQGMMLRGVPTVPGIYIHNGKKVVIK